MATPSERLIERWATPEGRLVLEEVLRDLHQEGGLNMPAILERLDHTAEVRDGLDLRFAPLVGQQLDEVNLYAVDLTGATLAGSSMHRADVRDALLPGANLEGVDLRGAYLSGSDLTGANLKGAMLDGAMLDGATLTGANLVGASCQDVYFAAAQLDGADLRQANLHQADLSGTSCKGATISAGALERMAIPPEDRGALVVEAMAPARVTRSLTPRGLQRPGAGPASPPSGAFPIGPARGATGRMRRPPPAPAAPPPAPRPTVRRSQQTTANFRRALAASPPDGALRGSAAPTPAPAQNVAAHRDGVARDAALRDWDQAMSRLFPLRRSVTRISIWVDGQEQVLYELPE